MTRELSRIRAWEPTLAQEATCKQSSDATRRCLQVAMKSGAQIVASRAGSKRLRDLAL